MNKNNIMKMDRNNNIMNKKNKNNDKQRQNKNKKRKIKILDTVKQLLQEQRNMYLQNF